MDGAHKHEANASRVGFVNLHRSLGLEISLTMTKAYLKL